LVWIDKGLTMLPDTLRQIHHVQPRCKIIGFSPDDMMNPANQTKAFLQCLPLFDAFVTNKSYNVSELQSLGCPRVIFTDNGFCPRTHRPMPVSAADRERLGGLVGFIGQWEPERAEALRFLAQNGIRVRVWGYTWERMKKPPANLILENRPLWGDDYARAICAFDINLCFLRKCNRDLQTTRSIEIPACGGFMLAERTPEHERLFQEGTDAEFFVGNEELLAKVRLYRCEDARRNLIARNGRERCLSGGYSNTARLANVLKQLLPNDSRAKRRL
jgi:spore maturation protein CgeB